MKSLKSDLHSTNKVKNIYNLESTKSSKYSRSVYEKGKLPNNNAL